MSIANDSDTDADWTREDRPPKGTLYQASVVESGGRRSTRLQPSRVKNNDDVRHSVCVHACEAWTRGRSNSNPFDVCSLFIVFDFQRDRRTKIAAAVR